MSVKAADPIAFGKWLWPDVHFYREQRAILYSLADNDETICHAGNMLGKDYVSGFAVLWFFLTRHPCRIVTTSVDYSQLEGVLWGEIRRFIQTARYPLIAQKGGPLIVNHLHIRKLVNEKVCGLSYLIGRVAAKGEGLLGHHIADVGDGIPRTLLVGDEASGLEDIVDERVDTWARRKLYIGNTYPCNNFFYRGVKEGDKYTQDGRRCLRKIIKIRGEDSPNVRYAQSEIKAGFSPSGKVLVPGVLPYADYVKRRETWDEVRQTIGLDAEFPDTSGVLLYPPQWLDLSHRRADQLKGTVRQAKAMGIDPAEGSDSTVWTIVDELGIIHQLSLKTPDTSVITGRTIALIQEYSIDPSRVVFDRGGGGTQIADMLRKQGYPVRSVGFGETPTIEPRRGLVLTEEKRKHREERYVYKNLRAEMFWRLREFLNPEREEMTGVPSFAIPSQYAELRRQLAPIPLWYDEEGRFYLPPKQRRADMRDGKQDDKDSQKVTMNKLIGRSPDEADSLVLALHGLSVKARRTMIESVKLS